MIANGVEHVYAALPFLHELLGRRRAMEHLRRVWRLSSEAPQRLSRRVAKGIVPPRRVEPVSPLLGRDVHGLGPLLEQPGHTLDVGASLLGDLRPGRKFD